MRWSVYGYAGLSPPGTQEPYTRESFEEDPMPDHENVLTD